VRAGCAILGALGRDVTPEIAPHIQGLMGNIEHFAGAIRAYGLDPQPPHERPWPAPAARKWRGCRCAHAAAI
jgi:hypothetical protein